MVGPSIRTLLVLSIAAVGLPLVGIILYVLDRDIETRMQVARGEVVDRANAAALHVGRLIEQGDRIAQRYVEAALGPAADRANCEANVRELVGLMPLYTNIVIVGREGNRLCNALREPPGQAPGFAGAVTFRRVVADRKPVFGAPTRGLTTGRWIVPVWYPRLDAQGELVGAVALPLDVEVLEKELARLTHGAGEAISILASDGTLVARSSQSVSMIERKASYPSLFVGHRGETAEPVEITGIDGVERIAAVAALPAAGWFVYAGLDRAVVLEPVYKARRRAAALVAMALVAALLAAAWASRRIGDPIAELAAAARRLQPGSAAGRVRVAGPAEVAQVARDLNAALDARERAEAELRTIIDHSPEFIHLCDPQGRILLANRAFLAILGTDAQGARGRAVRDFAVPHDNADRFEQQLAEVLRTGQPVVAEGLSLRPQGPRHLLINRFPVRDADGRIRAVGSIAVDVTEQRRLTDALRESEARFRTLAELAPVGIYRCDAVGVCTYVNRSWCEISGLTAEQSMGKGWASALHPDDLPRKLSAWSKFLNGEASYRMEVRLRRPDGSLRWALCEAVAVRGADGAIVEVLGTVTDITEQKAAESRDRAHVARLATLSRRLLGVQESERRAVARELHDEVGQSLTAVNVHLQRLAQGAGPELAHQLAGMRELVDTVIAQVRDTSFALRPVMLDDLGLVPALRWLVERVRDASGLDIRLDVTAVGDELPADATTTCFRVAQEALTNAVRHARAAHVRLRLEGGDGRLRLCVEDDGTGFDATDMRSGAVAGRCFGLDAMGERVELAGGVLRITSQPGAGTRIEMEIPLLQADAATA